MSEFLRHINKPKPPEPWYIKAVSYLAAAIIFILGGFLIVIWNYFKARDRLNPLGGRLRDID